MNATVPRSAVLKRLMLALAMLVGFSIPAAVGTGPAQAAAPACPTVYWGSLPERASGMTTQPIVAVRTGEHRCYDRVVIDLAGAGRGRLGYDVRYVAAVHREGTGTPLTLRGAADLQITVRAPAYNVRTGATTFDPAHPNRLANLTGYSALRQLAYAGSFEGYTTFGLGVRARLPMRAFVLDGPGSGHRLVIDVYHHW